MHFIGICASLRKASFNRMLLDALVAATPASSRIDIVDIAGLPMYDGDIEALGIPPAVTALKDRVASSDGIVLCSPEHNGSVPAAGKNAIDWLSRPPQDQARVLRGKPVALAGATVGRLGTAMAQSHWGLVFRALGMSCYPTMLMVSGANDVFGADGQVKDPATQAKVTSYMAGFETFARRFAGS